MEILIESRRKFRSETSDNMARWKSRGGKSQRREEKKRRSEQRKSQKKEDAGARIGRKVAIYCVFLMICGSRGSDYVVARSTFGSQIVQSTPASDHFWKLRCRKSARRCGTKHNSKSKCAKHTILRPLLEVDMSKKCSRWAAKHISKSTC